ncbi:MAG: LCP family protein [Chloroflexi bacterium]|nr:LCP family protein [Chloroflexota bacterium]
MNQRYNRPMVRTPRRRTQIDNTTKILLGAFVIVGILLAIVGGNFVFNLVKSWSLTADLPGAPVSSEEALTTSGDPVAKDNPLQSNSGLQAAEWDGHSRVNILLLGLDYSDARAISEPGPRFSDTMILVTIDPVTRTIGALSIRRDLWVNVPGFDYNKINKAYWLGEAYQLPGFGPGLAIQTVEEFLGVPINFYAQVDFNTFVTLIDEIKGVKLNITERILIDPIGKAEPRYLEPGIQVLPGNLALAYARVRNTVGDDVARGSRQMEVIMAIRDRILDFNMLPSLITRAPAIYNEVSKGVQTNLSLNKAIELARLMIQVPRENMHTYNIDYTMVTQELSPDGLQEILRPIPDKIGELRDQIFVEGSVAAALVVLDPSSDPLPKAKLENGRVEILNGTSLSGLAETTSAYLTSQGLNIVNVGSSDSPCDYTTIITHNPIPYTSRYLAGLFQIPNNRIWNQFDPNGISDITICLGNDWASNNPMP